MGEPNISLYCHLMEEIKRRTTVIMSFLKGESHTVYKATTVESMCLQVRKILELVELGSLVANKEEFSKQNEKFEQVWNARLILNDIERINPSFYPRPIEEMPSQRPEIKSDWKDIKNDFLDKEKFIKVYEKCGKIMHADNPYGGKIDYGLMKLLNENQFGSQVKEVLQVFDSTQKMWTQSKSRFGIKDNKEFTELLIAQAREHFMKSQVPEKEEETKTKYQGNILRIIWNSGNWFGFIKRGEQHDNLYFNNRGYRGETRNLLPDIKVEFELGHGEKGDYAKNVVLI